MKNSMHMIKIDGENKIAAKPIDNYTANLVAVAAIVSLVIASALGVYSIVTRGVTVEQVIDSALPEPMESLDYTWTVSPRNV